MAAQRIQHPDPFATSEDPIEKAPDPPPPPMAHDEVASIALDSLLSKFNELLASETPPPSRTPSTGLRKKELLTVPSPSPVINEQYYSSASGSDASESLSDIPSVPEKELSDILDVFSKDNKEEEEKGQILRLKVVVFSIHCLVK